jgi:flagellar hook protein FlgE
VISNDLSNLNTTAFKTGTPVFSSLFYQMLGTDGAGDPVQVGVGATMSSVSSPFTQGNVSSTGVPTDVAIQGNGLFIVDQNGTNVYSRAGNFTLSSSGNLIDTNGNNVLGYPAVNGTINTNQALAPIVIPLGQTYPPSATSTVELDMNLDAADTSLAPATGTLTVPGPALPTAGQTVSLGGTVYTFASSITAASPANTVLIGATASATLANLAGAINASTTNGQAAGTTYSSATTPNPAITATVSADVLSLQATNAGAAGNTLGTSGQWTGGTFSGADLAGGVDDQQATGTLTVPPTAGQTVTIGDTNYTFAASLTSQSPAGTVLVGSTVQATLANLAAAINATPADAGTLFSAATLANGAVTAMGSTATSITLQATQSGASGNSIATSSQWGAGTFSGAGLAGGVDDQQATATFTAPSGSQPIAGDAVAFGGTTYTFASSISAASPSNTVLIGTDTAATLANLAGAINAASTGGQAVGTTYSAGTLANTSVTATGSTPSTVTVQALPIGAAGNSLTASTSWNTGVNLSGGAAQPATATFAVPPGAQPAAGDTVTIGAITYTFVANSAALTAPDEVAIGPNVPTTLSNLMAAINADPTQAGAAFTAAGTAQNPLIAATGFTSTTISLQARLAGSVGNGYNTSTSWTNSLSLSGGNPTTAATATFATPVGAAVPNPGDTFAIGGDTYTFVANAAALTSAGDVLIGPTVQSTLANLAGAIGASVSVGPPAQGPGVSYGTGTIANQQVNATGTTATTITLQAAQNGVGGNSLAAVTTWAAGLLTAGTLAGGQNAALASADFTLPAAALPPSPGDTFSIGGTTYTFASSITASSPADTVMIGGSVQSTLANLAAAINLGAGSGTAYSSNTLANGVVSAPASTATTITLQAIQSGAAGDSLAATTTWGAGLLTAGNLTGGVDALAAASTLMVPPPALPHTGDTVAIGGTTYTFVANLSALTAPDDVLIGSDVPSTLANLAGAINAATTGGQAAGLTYGPGTVANPKVTATATPTTVNLQAIPVGTAGNGTISTSTTWASGAFGAPDLAGGVSAVAANGSYTLPVALPAAGQTVTIGASTYTFVASAAALTAAGDVLIGADVQSALANLAGAINAASGNGQGAGLTYGPGTAANTAVTATGSTASTLSLQAISSGTGGNSTATTTTWTAGSFGAGDLTGGTDAGTYSDSIMVYDSLGNSHVLTFNFTKGASGQWNYQITIPGADVGATSASQVVATGTLEFDPSGNLISPTTNVAVQINNLADGASTLDYHWTLFNPSGAPVITQTAEPSAISAQNQNGYSPGNLQSYNVESSGIIQGVLSNDQDVSLGQIALATFPNYDGLTSLGSNDYQASLASGTASVGVPGVGGRGTLEGASLEQSNVDIATEFTMLIQAERGYEANAKAITTADDVMQSSIALIQS